jgi:excinuclease ABC subunit B
VRAGKWCPCRRVRWSGWRFEGGVGNLWRKEAARLRDDVKRLEAVELAVADYPLARQSVVEEAVDEAVTARGRSTGGRGRKPSRGARR